MRVGCGVLVTSVSIADRAMASPGTVESRLAVRCMPWLAQLGRVFVGTLHRRSQPTGSILPYSSTLQQMWIPKRSLHLWLASTFQQIWIPYVRLMLQLCLALLVVASLYEISLTDAI